MSYLWYWPAGGWDFDKWKAQHPWEPISADPYQQWDRRRLSRQAPNLSAWEAAREAKQAISDVILGRPVYVPPDRIEFHILEERAGLGYRLRRLRYTLTGAEWGYAWLALPERSNDCCRAVIALHQTVPQGKDEPMGLDGDPELAYGKELALRGYSVLAPDAIGFGERAKGLTTARYHDADGFFREHPRCSVMGKMSYDVSRAVDLLAILPETRGMQVGCIGHSHGGYGTLFAMLADSRIAAGVVSCGITPLRTDPTPERWWRMTALIPRLGFYEGRMADTPLDFPDWMALVAPRPLMVCVALDDAIFPNLDTMPRILQDVRHIYSLYGAEADLMPRVFRGAHNFPRAARTYAYRLLDRALA